MKSLRVPLLFVLAAFFAAILFLYSSSDAQGQSAQEIVGGVEIVEDTLYVTVLNVVDGNLQDVELRVYDVSDALSPVEIASLSLPGFGGLIVEPVGLAYARWRDQLIVFDVSDPSAPAVLSQGLDVAGGWRVHERDVYAFDWEAEEIRIYRVDDAGQPQHASTYSIPPREWPESQSPEETMSDGGMMIDWPYLYYHITRPRLDVSDPENPVAAGDWSIIAQFRGSTSIKNGVGYAGTQMPKTFCAWDITISDIHNEWAR